jgi:hypothetical protein
MESTVTLNEAADSNAHEGESKKDKALGRIGCTAEQEWKFYSNISRSIIEILAWNLEIK